MDCSKARTRDPVEWMESCPDFSWPMAEQIREWILGWEPDLTESIKWNMLCFSARKLVCGISACRKHLSLTCFRGGELPDPRGLFNQRGQQGQVMSIKITSQDELERLDRRALERLIHAAVELDCTPSIDPPKGKRPPPKIPSCLESAFATNLRAAAGWQQLATTYQREYVSWLNSAKRPETRAKRLRETLAAVELKLKWVDRKRATP